MTSPRRLLATTFLLGSVGTGAELFLMEHTETGWQRVPLILLAIGCAALAAFATTARRAVRTTFLGVMMIFAASGLAGSGLHVSGNLSFELELDPEASGFVLLRDAMQGAAPALAPGTMLLLAAVGWAYARVTDLERKEGRSSGRGDHENPSSRTFARARRAREPWC